MRIAFISLNQEKLPDAVVPIGLLYVMANTPPQHTTVFWDLCFESDIKAYLDRNINAFKPEVLAVGMRNIQNNDYSGYKANLESYKKVIETLRLLSPGTPIVLGGSGFSVMPQGIMAQLRPDYGISGEGERSFTDLLAALEGERDIALVPNAHYFADDRLVSNDLKGDFVDMNLLRSPDFSVADPRYFEAGGTANVQTKRGCPLSCTYCTYPAIEGKTKRTRDARSVVDDMERTLSLQPLAGHFFIVDSVFNLPKAHAKEVCREMIRRGFKTPWTCYVNPIGFDQELAVLMKQAGCAGMEVGSDSGVDSVLKLLRKGFTTSQIKDLSKISKTVGLKDCHTFILGTPGETLEQVRETLHFITQLDPYCAILGVWIDDYEALDPALAALRIAFRDEIKKLLWEERAKYSHWVIPSLKVNFDERFFAFLHRRKVKGPLWQCIRGVPERPPLPVL